MRTLAIVLLLITSVVLVQADQIDRIRDHYDDVKDNLDDYYRTEISINTKDRSYPALGNYQEEITFYWGSEAGYHWLVLATWTGEYAAYNEYGEVLFSEPAEPWEGDTGELVFQFVTFDNSDDNVAGLRWWYSGGELLQSIGETTYSDGEEFEYAPNVPRENAYAHDPAELLEMFNSIHD